MKEHKPIDPQFQIQLEAEFERLTSLQSDCWQTELEKRTDLTEKVKSALLELLKAHDTMPMRFMDSEVIREMYDQANLKSDEDVASTSPPSFENGTLIGSYRLETEIGQGGFGVVWLAKQVEPYEREVAIKILKLGMDSRAILKRFKVEQQILAMMDHPNIARLIESGTTRTGQPFFVMELARGLPITKYCDEKCLDIPSRLNLFIDVCFAVNHAHQKGAIHCDLKPSNILIVDTTKGPLAKVIDFGISQVIQTPKFLLTQVVTAEGQIFGTPDYMAPEQFYSDKATDTLSDIYSLGAILYELLIGKPPCCSEESKYSSQEIKQRGERDLQTPSEAFKNYQAADRIAIARARNSGTQEIQRRISKDLEAIPMKALRNNPTERYATVIELLNDIRRSMSNLPIQARPQSKLYSFQKFFRRNRVAVVAASIIVFSFFISALFSSHQASLAQNARIKERELRLHADKLSDLAKEAESLAIQEQMDAQERAYLADMQLTAKSLEEDNLRESRRLLNQYSKGSSNRDLRGWEWRYFWGQGQPQEILYESEHSSRVLTTFFTNTPTRLISFRDHGSIELINTNSHQEKKVLSAETKSNKLLSDSGFLCKNINGSFFAGLSFQENSEDYVIKIWANLDKPPVRAFPIGPHRPTGLALSPNGRKLAYFLPADGSAHIIQIDSQEILHSELLNEPNYGPLDTEGACCFSPNGEQLAIGGRNGKLTILDTSDWSKKHHDLPKGGNIATLAFSPDNKTLAVGRIWFDPSIWIIDVSGSNPEIQLTGHQGFVSNLTFSPNGKLLASSSGDQNIKLWSTENWSELKNLSGHSDEVWCVDFSADGQRLVSAGKDRKIIIWDLKDWTGNFKKPPGIECPLAHTAVSPCGNKLLVLEKGVLTLKGNLEGSLKGLPDNLSKAYWVSSNRLVCTRQNPPELFIWNLKGNLEKSIRFPESKTLKSRYLESSQTILVARNFIGSRRILLNRFDATSLELITSSQMRFSETMWTSFENPLRVSFSSRGEKVAIRTERSRIVVHDVLSGDLIKDLSNEDGNSIQGQALSPDGNTLAYATRQRPYIEIYDLLDDRPLTTLKGHNLVLYQMSFSPDGKRLVSSSIGYSPIILWDTKKWSQVASLPITPGSVTPVTCFSQGSDNLIIYESLLDSNTRNVRILKAPSLTEIENFGNATGQ